MGAQVIKSFISLVTDFTHVVPEAFLLEAILVLYLIVESLYDHSHPEVVKDGLELGPLVLGGPVCLNKCVLHCLLFSEHLENERSEKKKTGQEQNAKNKFSFIAQDVFGKGLVIEERDINENVQGHKGQPEDYRKDDDRAWAFNVHHKFAGITASVKRNSGKAPLRCESAPVCVRMLMSPQACLQAVFLP